MSLDKAIEHGKEHRKPYYRRGKYDCTCRPHGGKPHGKANQCPWCLEDRMHSTKRRQLSASADEMAD